MRSTSKLRGLIEGDRIVVSVGGYDALCAKIAERVGIDVVTMGGYHNSAVLLGAPDYGWLTMTEMVRQAYYIAHAADVCVLADIDTGYGNALNAYRTVQEFERAGVAGVILEDQVTPKRCGHMEGKQVVPAEEYAKKLQAALDARQDKDLVIVARTDARAVYGLDEAIRRAKLYREVGADVIFVEAPQSIEELKKVADSVEGPLLANMVEGGKTPFLSAAELERMGYRIVLYSLGTLFAATKALIDFMSHVKAHGTTEGFHDRMVSFTEMNSLLGLGSVREMEARYSLKDA